jgi:tRNA dimethylallyltransferase
LDLDRAPLCAIVGPTAAGKTALAVQIARQVGAEIVSVDSMQVYRGMDVGTAKPGPEVTRVVRHHLIDCADPDERYDARRYLEDVRAARADLDARGVRPLFAGGTGFYLKALTHGLFDGPPADLDLRRELVGRAREVGSPALHAELAGIDPLAAARIHPNDERRVIRGLEVWRQTGRALSEWQREWRDAAQSGTEGRARCLVGLEVEPEELDRRIAARTREMLDGGWPEEARAIRDGRGFGPSAIQALGYREVLAYVDGELTREEVELEIGLRTRQFARRQRTWFRQFPEIRWIPAPRDADELAASAPAVLRLLGW